MSADRLAELGPVQQQEDEQARAFIAKIASRFIGPEGIQPPGPDETVEIMVRRIRNGEHSGTIIESVCVRQTGSTGSDPTPFTDVGIWSPDVGNLRADSHRLGELSIAGPQAFSVHPEIVLRDSKTGDTESTGADAVAKAERALTESGFRSLPSARVSQSLVEDSMSGIGPDDADGISTARAGFVSEIMPDENPMA